MKTIKITNLNDEVTEWCKVEDVLGLIDDDEFDGEVRWRYIKEKLKKRING